MKGFHSSYSKKDHEWSCQFNNHCLSYRIRTNLSVSVKGFITPTIIENQKNLWALQSFFLLMQMDKSWFQPSYNSIYIQITYFQSQGSFQIIYIFFYIFKFLSYSSFSRFAPSLSTSLMIFHFILLLMRSISPSIFSTILLLEYVTKYFIIILYLNSFKFFIIASTSANSS